MINVSILREQTHLPTNDPESHVALVSGVARERRSSVDNMVELFSLSPSFDDENLD